MESDLFSPRNPIRKLFRHEIGEMDHFLDFFGRNFDMYQIMHTSTLSSAVKFAYLCHMLRPTMLKDEYISVFEGLPEELQLVLSSRGSEQCLSTVITSFERSITESQLKAMDPPEALIRQYTIERKGVVMEQFPTSSSSSVPVIHVLSLKDKQAILYTPAATFMDGFEPYTGEPKACIMPALLVKKTRDALFAFSRRKHKKKIVASKNNSDLEYSEEMKSDCNISNRSEKKTVFEDAFPEKEEENIQEIVEEEIQDISKEIIIEKDKGKDKHKRSKKHKESDKYRKTHQTRRGISDVPTNIQKKKYKAPNKHPPEWSNKNREDFDEKLDRIFAEDSFHRRSPPIRRQTLRKSHNDPRGCCINECILF